MKWIAIILLAIALLGCESDAEVIATPDYATETCVKGHQYVIIVYYVGYKGFLGLAPIFNDDGLPKRCKEDM